MTDRIALDDLTSDQLDALYADLDRYEEVVGELNEANTGLQREAAHLRTQLAKSEQGRRNLVGLLNHHRDMGTLGLLRATGNRLDRALKACARYRAEVTRLTAGQCTHTRRMCDLHHQQPVTDCPYPKCIKARQQAEESSGRPTHPDGTAYRYHEIVAGGWSHCEGCRTWSQGATPENPHECPMTYMHGPATA